MDKTKKYILLVALVGSVLAGFLAGLFGNFLNRYYLSNMILSDLYLSGQDNLGKKDVIIKEAKKVVVEQDVRVHQVINESNGAFYAIYRKKPSSRDLMSSIYLPSEMIAQAVAVTSDGWLISSYSGDYPVKSAVVVKDDKVYQIEKIIADTQSRLHFIKVAEIQSPVLEFAAMENVANGQTVLAINAINNSSITSQVRNAEYKVLAKSQDLVETLDQYGQRLQLDQSLEDVYLGSPILDLNGQIVGLVDGKDQVIKINYINSLLKSILKNGRIVRPYFGFNYLDLKYASGTQYFGEGVMVIKNSAGIAVKTDSPFAKDLKDGDILTAVENIDLGKQVNYADLMLDYKIGQKITFKVKRGKESMDVSQIIISK